MAGDFAAELEALEDRFGLDVDATLATAVEIERATGARGEVALRLRARLVMANMWRRNGDIAAAVALCREVNAWAAAHEHRPLLARSHQLLSAIYDNLGDTAAGLEHAVYAVEFLDHTAPPRARGISLMKLGDDLAMGGSSEAARERYRQAEQVAVASDDRELQMVVLNNLAYAELIAGEAELAWAAIDRLRLVCAAQGEPLKPDALDTMARIEIARGRYLAAEQAALASLREHPTSGIEDVDSLAQFLLTLAVAQRHLDATAAAQVSLDRCMALCDERDLAGVRVQAMQEQAELYAACDDFRRAFSMYKNFHAAERDLTTRQREAQARTRQAMLETTEARQDAERFREQALRDPLTGLHNRRYIDEHLPGLLADAGRTGGLLIVAMLDLDHFKRINDTRSHDAGDEVLVAVARLIAAAVPNAAIPAAAIPAAAVPGVDPEGGGFAARLGGEEFLLVLTDSNPASVVDWLDDLRRTIAGQVWYPVTGDLPVTVSIGVTAARPDSTQASLLARADRSLYAAKHEGRNRVSIDPDVALVDRRSHARRDG